MSFQRVPPANGLQWLSESLSLILANPVPFLLMGLVVGIIGMVPILGGLALAVLGPALYGGIMFAAREQTAGRKADFTHLFQAFRESGALPRLLLLCLPGIAAGVLIVLLAVMLLGGALLGAGLTGATGGDAGAVGAGLGIGAGLLFAALALAIGLATFALTFFATPRVMLDAAEPFAAMKESAQACLANIGAVLLYLGVLALGMLVAAAVLSLIPIIGTLVLMVFVVPLVAVAAFVAWRQVFRQPITQELPPAAPPPGVEV